MPVKPVPDGYPSVTTYLIVRGAARAIDYYTKAFNGVELRRLARGSWLVKPSPAFLRLEWSGA